MSTYEAYIQPLLFVLAKIYFTLVNIAFWLLNFFKKRETLTEPKPPEQLLLYSASRLAEKIREGELTATEVIQAYIKRIEKVNPTINAVATRSFDDAISAAIEVDTELAGLAVNERRELGKKRPLLGVPFTCKDAFDVAGVVVSSGSVFRAKHVAKEDAGAIARLRAAGAIFLTSTVVPEQCMWAESANRIHGRVKNPHDSRRHPGGSSGGEVFKALFLNQSLQGALIAAAGSVFGLGSDIGGSIRIPSIMNGVYGLKPTPRKSRGDEERLQVLGGEEAEKILNPEKPIDFRRLKIYYMEGLRSPFIETLSDDMRGALRKAVRHFEQEFDAVPVRIDLEDAHAAIDIIFASFHNPGATADFSDVLANFEYKLNELTELPKALRGRSNHTVIALVMSILLRYLAPSSERKLNEALYRRDRLKRQLDELLGEDGVFLFPGWPHNADFHNQPTFKFFDFVYTGLFSALTLPVVACPMGKDSKGLPLGIQIVGPHRSEARLIAVAEELDAHFDGWALPENKFS